MYNKLSEEFKEFEKVAEPFAESFLKEHVDLIEQKAGLHRENFNFKKLTQFYVMYEFLSHKHNCGQNLNESNLLSVLRSAKKIDYINTLRDYSNTCGKLCTLPYSTFNLVCKMAKFSMAQLGDENALSSENVIIIINKAE